MTSQYILADDGETPIPCDSATTWSRWLKESNRKVAKTTVGGAEVSTVFLGLDFSGQGPPILWETMIFGGTHDQYQERYTSLADAREGREKAVALLESSID